MRSVDQDRYTSILGRNPNEQTGSCGVAIRFALYGPDGKVTHQNGSLHPLRCRQRWVHEMFAEHCACEVDRYTSNHIPVIVVIVSPADGSVLTIEGTYAMVHRDRTIESRQEQRVS